MVIRGRGRLIAIDVAAPRSRRAVEVVDAVRRAAETAGFRLAAAGDPVAARVRVRPGVSGVEVRITLTDPAARPGAGVIGADDAAAIRLAVHHLAALGHRRIALAFDADAAEGPLRRAAYIDAMASLGLGRSSMLLGPADIGEALTGSAGGTSPAAADATAGTAPGAAAPTALCAADAASVHAVQSATAAGAPPVSVVACESDDESLARVDVRIDEVARRALELLATMLVGDWPRTETVSPVLRPGPSAVAAPGWTVPALATLSR
ncbi:substrate-binding domain-containing protein [Microbacterium aureliae]